MTDDPGEPGAFGEPGDTRAPAAPDAEPPADDPDTFETLANDLRGPMLGAPRQRITGLVIVAIVGLALLFGITALARDGAFNLDVGGPLFGTPSPSAAVTIRVG